jgi:hypothetical protein
VGFSDDQLLARKTPDLRPPAQGLSDEDLLRREGLAPQRDQFGGIRVGYPPQRDQFGGIRVGYPPPPRAKPTPPPTAGEQYARGLAAGHFAEGDETPLTRTLKAGQEQMDVPDSQSHYMNRALNAWQAMGAQGAGEVAKVGANALGIETGPPEQAAGELMSALPGLMGAEGAPHVTPRAAEAVKPLRERIEPIPPKLPETPSAAKTALVNIAQGKPADAPPAADVTLPIAPGESAPRPTPTKRVVQGLNVNVENPQGSLRTGTGDNGMPWQVHMPADYGEIEGTRGADGSPVDAYVGPHPESRRAFVDQYDPQGNFDEHKVVLAACTAKDATAIYDAGFSDGSGPARRGAITEVPVPRLKAWLKDGDTTQPFAGGEHAAPPAPKEAPVRRPVNLAEFLARRGGIARDPGGDLAAMDLHKQFVPGAGMLVRKKGMQLDYAREAAEEAGYLPEGSTTADLLDALDRNRRGHHVFSHHDTGNVVAWKDQQLAKGRASRADAQEEPEAEEAPAPPPERHELESRAEGLGIERHAHLSDEELLAEIHGREAMMVEGAAMPSHVDQMKAEFDSAKGEALPGEDYGEIPGFEGPVESPRGSARDAEAREQPPPHPGEAPGGEGAGEVGPGDREGTPKNRGDREGLESPAPDWAQHYARQAATEKTAQGNQTIMPGMERSARQAQASRDVAGRGMITPTRPQKPADEGLFAKPSQQPDMFDKATRDKAHADADALRQAWASAKANTEAPLHDDFARFAAMRGGIPANPLARALMAAQYIVRRGAIDRKRSPAWAAREGAADHLAAALAQADAAGRPARARCPSPRPNRRARTASSRARSSGASYRRPQSRRSPATPRRLSARSVGAVAGAICCPCLLSTTDRSIGPLDAAGTRPARDVPPRGRRLVAGRTKRLHQLHREPLPGRAAAKLRAAASCQQAPADLREPEAGGPATGFRRAPVLCG